MNLINKSFNKTEIAERYYKALGKFTSRIQSRKNFSLLRKPDKKLISKIVDEIYREQKDKLK